MQEKYPDFLIIYDDISKKYKVKFTEVSREKGSVNFNRKEKEISKKLFDSIAKQILES